MIKCITKEKTLIFFKIGITIAKYKLLATSYTSIM